MFDLPTGAAYPATMEMTIRVHRADTNTVDEYRLIAVEQPEFTKDSPDERDPHHNAT